MVRRWCESKGIAVERIAWNELERVSSINGPLVTIGGGKVAIEKAHSSVTVLMLHLDGGAVPAFFKAYFNSYVIGLQRSRKCTARLKISAYPRANTLILVASLVQERLASAKTLDAFEALLEELMQRYEPAQLRLTSPQQVSLGESAQIAGAVVNSRLEALPANFSIEINQGATLIEQVTLSPEGNSVIGTFTPQSLVFIG